MLSTRASGVLLHLTSLPGPHGSGDCGPTACDFVDWLVAADQRFWQVLPLTPIGQDNSPYTSPSAFAGNPLLIDLAALQNRGWLGEDKHATDVSFAEDHVDFAKVARYRMQRLEEAWQAFQHEATERERDGLAWFCARQTLWMEDYALFTALHAHYGTDSWLDWPQALVSRRAEALAQARVDFAERIAFCKFCQWCFRRQWLALKSYANERGIGIIGEMPMFLAHHSADVWAHPELFDLGPDGKCRVIAGVPPDAFSAQAQRWNQPLYRWEQHVRDGFRWWIKRFHNTLDFADRVRIDHFRGFVHYWEIPAQAKNGRNGRWKPAPGEKMFAALQAALGPIPAIADDAGAPLAEVEALRRRFSIPGTRILQFAFNGHESTFLPHKHERDTVVYVGTHDNNTAQGWWAEASQAERQYAMRYLGISAQEVHWELIRAACASAANTESPRVF